MNKNNYKFKSKISKYFIDYLKKKNIDYCYLGDHTNFPEKIHSDVDIFIDFKVSKELKKILYDFLKNKNLNIVNFIQHEFNSFTVVLSQRVNDSFEFIAFDICNEYVINSRKILSFQKIKKNILIKKKFSFKILPNEYEFLYYLIKKIYKNDVNKKTFLYLSKVFKSLKNANELHLISKKHYIILKKIFTSNKMHLFNKHRNYFKKKLVDSKKFLLIEELKRYCLRLGNKTGFHVVLLGVDGTGKTSQIDFLMNSSVMNAFKGCKVYHLFSKPSNNNKTTLLPYQHSNYNSLISLIKISYLFIRYFYNYFFNLFPKLVSSQLIINDRYYHDVIIDPSRYRIGYFKKFLNFIFQLLPEPDLIIILNVKYSSLIKRKNELSLKQIKVSTLRYKNYKKKYKNCYIINTNKTIEKTNKKIIELIVYNKVLLHKKSLKKG